MNTIHKPKAIIDPEGEPIKAPAWKNISFRYDGKSFVGVRTYPSESAAKQGLANALADSRTPYIGFSCGTEIHQDLLTHHIQMPVAE